MRLPFLLPLPGNGRLKTDTVQALGISLDERRSTIPWSQENRPFRRAILGALQEENMAMQENRVELKNSVRAPMRGASIIGPADPNEEIQVTVTLRRGSA